MHSRGHGRVPASLQHHTPAMYTIKADWLSAWHHPRHGTRDVMMKLMGRLCQMFFPRLNHQNSQTAHDQIIAALSLVQSFSEDKLQYITLNTQQHAISPHKHHKNTSI